MSNVVRDAMAIDQFTKEKLKAKKMVEKNKKGVAKDVAKDVTKGAEKEDEEEGSGDERKKGTMEGKDEKGVLRPTTGDLVADSYLMAQLCAPKKGKGGKGASGKGRKKAGEAVVATEAADEE